MMKMLKPSLASSMAYPLPIPEAPPNTEKFCLIKKYSGNVLGGHYGSVLGLRITQTFREKLSLLIHSKLVICSFKPNLPEITTHGSTPGLPYLERSRRLGLKKCFHTPLTNPARCSVAFAAPTAIRAYPSLACGEESVKFCIVDAGSLVCRASLFWNGKSGLCGILANFCKNATLQNGEIGDAILCS